jgi:uncharacterized RDD family membrane protein YckC
MIVQAAGLAVLAAISPTVLVLAVAYLAGPRRATIRTLAFPLSFLLRGLGFTGIFLQRNRRALHDMIAGTAVVYTWDARAARLRFLDRDAPQNPR